jgi:hypothetical protein
MVRDPSVKFAIKLTAWRYQHLPYPMTLYSIHDMELQTDRLILRQWQSSDLPVFAQINSSKLAM